MSLPRTRVHVGHHKHLVADVAILDHVFLAPTLPATMPGGVRPMRPGPGG